MAEEKAKDTHWSTDDVEDTSRRSDFTTGGKNGGEQSIDIKDGNLMRLVSGDNDRSGAEAEDAPLDLSDDPTGVNTSEPSEGADHLVSTNEMTDSDTNVAKDTSNPYSTEMKEEKGEEFEKDGLHSKESDNEQGPAAKKQKTELGSSAPVVVKQQMDADETFTIHDDENRKTDLTSKNKEESFEDIQPTGEESQVEVDNDTVKPLSTEETRKAGSVDHVLSTFDEAEVLLNESAAKALDIKDLDSAKPFNPHSSSVVESTSTEFSPSLSHAKDESKTVGDANVSLLLDSSKSKGSSASGACGDGDSVEAAQDPAAAAPLTGEMKHDDSSSLKEDCPKSNGNADKPVDAAVQSSSNDCEERSGETKLPKHVRSKHVDPKILSLRHRIQGACRDNDLEAAMKAYEEAVRNDIRLEAQSFYNLLNLCDGLERTVHVGTPKASGNGSSKAAPVDDNNKIDTKKRQD